MDHWQLELQDSPCEQKYNLTDETVLADIGELVGKNSGYILGHEIATHIIRYFTEIDTIIVDYSKIDSQSDFITGFKGVFQGRVIEIGKDIEVHENSISITDYPNGYNDRSFKLDIIKLVAGRKVTAIFGNPEIDYQYNCPFVVRVNPSEYTKWPIFDNAELIYSVSGLTLLIGHSAKDKFFCKYRLTDQLHLIEQSQQLDKDERCRSWFVLYSDW
jgi:hypothetical protein